MPEQAFRLAGFRAAAVIALLFLSGCAEFLAAREQSAQDWREARVVQIDTAASIARTSDRDCRKAVVPDEAAKTRYAVYEYRGVNRARWDLCGGFSAMGIPTAISGRFTSASPPSPSLWTQGSQLQHRWERWVGGTLTIGHATDSIRELKALEVA